MKHRLILAISTLAIVTAPTTGQARPNNPLSCSFVNTNAYNNEGDCMFMDSRHSSVLITPHRKITANKAVAWIISTSIALQTGGENQFSTITVLTSPNATGEYAEAKSSNAATVLQDPAVIKSLTKICNQPNDWSDIVGPDGKPAAPPKCRPLK